MKKILIILLATTLLGSFMGCTKNTATNNETKAEKTKIKVATMEEFYFKIILNWKL